MDKRLNFREVRAATRAGQLLRGGTLFRSGALRMLNDASRDALATLGLRTVVDLRSNNERLAGPLDLKTFPVEIFSWDHDYREGDIYEILRAGSMTPSNCFDLVKGFYRKVPYVFTEMLRTLFDAVASGQTPLLVCCSAGKDRTGMAIAILLAAIGVPRTSIYAEYLLSNDSKAELIAAIQARLMVPMLTELDPNVLETLAGVDVAFLDNMFAAIEERSGSLEAFVANDLNVSASELQRIKGRLLG